jgi:hypothetical protein
VALIDAVEFPGFLQRLCARAGIARSVSFSRAVERRLGAGARLALGALNRLGCRLMMKLGAKRLRSGWLSRPARRRGCLRFVDLPFDLQNLGGAWSCLGSSGTTYEPHCR